MARLDSGIIEHGATRDYTWKTTATYVSAADERVAQGRALRHMAWEPLRTGTRVLDRPIVWYEKRNWNMRNRSTLDNRHHCGSAWLIVVVASLKWMKEMGSVLTEIGIDRRSSGLLCDAVRPLGCWPPLRSSRQLQSADLSRLSCVSVTMEAR